MYWFLKKKAMTEGGDAEEEGGGEEEGEERRKLAARKNTQRTSGRTFPFYLSTFFSLNNIANVIVINFLQKY